LGTGSVIPKGQTLMVCLDVKFLKSELNSYLVCKFGGKENVFG
jgi:hypothetical protein